ncbi:MAG TPA: hypothetical protein VMU75_04930 [Acidimicrobiales bacterium]|nr:hypothetical protein [Acidimicrobiales bacterium]
MGTCGGRCTLVQGAVALVKSVLLAGGVPVALFRLWLLAPAPSRHWHAATFESAAFWDHAVLALVGLAWTWATCSLVCQLVRALRGGVTSGTSWAARWAARVAGLVLLIGAGSGLGVASSAAAAPVVVAARGAAGHAAAGAAVGETGPAPHGARVDTPWYVVRAGDCLALIAARELGSAAEWPAIARLNMGRRQPDGRRMTDPSLIYPGWKLVLPGATPGDVARRGPDRPVASHGRGADGRSTVAGAAAAARRTPPPPAPRTTTVARQQDGPWHPAPVAPRRHLDELALVGLGVLATAALARRLRLLHRIGECLRRPGERQPAVTARAGRAEALLGPLADAHLLEWIEGANRLLWRALRDSDDSRALPDVRVVRAGPDGVQLLLARALPAAPDPFVALDGGRWWSLDPTLDLDEVEALAAGCGRFLPWLVPVGEDETASFLLPVGPGRRLAVAGEGDRPLAAVSAMVAALRTVPWAEELRVELIGVRPPNAGERCYQLGVSSVQELRELASLPHADQRARLATAWSCEPLVVVAVADGTLEDALLQAVGPVAGIVSLGGSGTDRLEIGATVARIEPYGIELVPITPDAEQLALVDELLASAASEPERASTPVTARRPEAGAPARRAGPAGHLAPAGPVEVRLLGAVPEISGLAAAPPPTDAARVVEVVAYLALHEHRASVEALREAVFGRADHAGSLGRVHNVMSAARAALGRRRDGRAYLPPAGAGPYRLDEAVTSDWTRFCGAVAEARTAAPPVATALLREALELVRARPCADAHAGYDWLVAEGLLAAMTAEIVDAVDHLAKLAVAVADDDAGLAKWAIAKGRLVEPASETLARDLMVALGAEGDRDGVRRTWVELESSLDRLGGSEPCAETRELYRQLTGPEPPRPRLLHR